ncbi:uncharacterized protein [Rutidosis leptorrhynchoides]|uniref:uncharacterized protein isoform X2 n=1 Tax=Rutidosis leptorrhynchoides TaxID=125765 RepID=UPI003A9900CA
MRCCTAAVLNDEGGLIVKNYVAILDQVKRKKTTGSCSEAKRNLEEKKAIGAGEEERITEVDGNLMGSIIAQEIIIIIILEIDTASLKRLQLLEFEYMSGLPSYFVKPSYWFTSRFAQV